MYKILHVIIYCTFETTGYIFEFQRYVNEVCLWHVHYYSGLSGVILTSVAFQYRLQSFISVLSHRSNVLTSYTGSDVVLLKVLWYEYYIRNQ